MKYKISNSQIKARTVLVNKHKTCISLEEEFWTELKKISKNKKKSLNQIISKIDLTRSVPLSSAVRIYILNQIKKIKNKSN